MIHFYTSLVSTNQSVPLDRSAHGTELVSLGIAVFCSGPQNSSCLIPDGDFEVSWCLTWKSVGFHSNDYRHIVAES